MPTLAEWIKSVNALADEDMAADEVTIWINNAIARVNAAAHANFPFMDINKSDDSPVIPDKWQYLLILPYATARVKQKDSSQFEYSDLFAEFESNLRDFIVSYSIPEQYKDTETPTYEVQITDGIVSNDGGWDTW